jgi:hypothetical protein
VLSGTPWLAPYIIRPIFYSCGGRNRKPVRRHRQQKANWPAKLKKHKQLRLNDFHHQKLRDIFRMVMKRVPTGIFLRISRLPLTGQLTANAQGIPLGAFSFPAVLRAVCNIRRHAGDVSVLQPCPFGVLKSCRKNRPLSFGRKLRSAVLWECRIYQWVIQHLPSSQPTRITSPNVVRSEAGSPGAMSGPIPTAYPISSNHDRAAS